MTYAASKPYTRTAIRRSSRAIRYRLEERLEALARPYGMRFYVFELEIVNISRTGFFLAAKSDKFIPFAVGSKVHATIDLRSKLFDRPLHFIFEVARLDVYEGKKGFGVRILEVLGEHQRLFDSGMDKLGDREKYEE